MKDQILEHLIAAENKRQHDHVELIASENFVSDDVRKAVGSILTNKYAEGYPGRRYYDGCEIVDQIETLALTRVKKLFNVQYANVQPHSGTQANMAAFAALLKPGDRVLGMSLQAGGHLSHGTKITFSGTFYKAFTYGVNAQGLIDYDAVANIAQTVKPHLIVCGFSAYSRQVDFEKFRAIADQVGAYLLADIAHIAGLVATGAHPSPFPYADVITATTHKTLRGARGGIVMSNDQAIMQRVNKWVFPGVQGGPLLHAIAGKAVTFYEALDPSFKTYIKNVVANAQAFAQTFMQLGVPVVSHGTDTHLFTINVNAKYAISGHTASKLLEQNLITVNKNLIPGDKLSPQAASGVRLGTAAMTTRGMTKQDFVTLAQLIDQLLAQKVKSIKPQVTALLKKLPRDLS